MAKVFLSPATLVGASLAGALLLAAYVGSVAMRDKAPPDPAAVPHAAAEAPPQRVADTQPRPVRAQPVATIVSSCPSQPQVAARDASDGRFTLEAALASGSTIEPSAFIAVAREAAQQGRARDAETALLAACHLAERHSGAQSPAVADLKARIAALQDPSRVQVVAAGTIERTPTSVMGAARPYADAAPSIAPRGPSARLIREDPELAQLERDMQRLHDQASRVTRDPRGLSQRDSQALAWRDSGCQDKACLLRWYAQRRSQLLAEFRR